MSVCDHPFHFQQTVKKVFSLTSSVQQSGKAAPTLKPVIAKKTTTTSTTITTTVTATTLMKTPATKTTTAAKDNLLVTTDGYNCNENCLFSFAKLCCILIPS